MTYAEFVEAIKIKFKKSWPSLSENEVEQFIEQEKEYIGVQYAEKIEKLANGEITEEQFRVGGVSSVAYCLELLY